MILHLKRLDKQRYYDEIRWAELQPLSDEQMAANRRVVFLVVKIDAESIKGEDFNFDK